jgi:hypothetical protein
MYKPVVKPYPMAVVGTETKNLRVDKTTTAIRTNEFNLYYYKYYVGYPEVTTYDVCRPSSSSVFMMPNKYYKYGSSADTTNLISGNSGCESE